MHTYSIKFVFYVQKCFVHMAYYLYLPSDGSSDYTACSITIHACFLIMQIE